MQHAATMGRLQGGDPGATETGAKKPVLPSLMTQLVGGDRKPPPRLGQGRVHTLSDVPPHVLLSHEEKRRRVYDAISSGCKSVQEIRDAYDGQLPDQEIRAIARELEDEDRVTTSRINAPTGGSRLNFSITGKGRP